MSAHAYTEDQLVEQPAIGLFSEPGRQVALPHPHPGPLPEGEGVGAWVDESGLFGRDTKGEVVLESRLRAALEKLNPTLPPEAIAGAIDGLARDRSAMLLEQANREVYRLLKEGIPVSVPDTDSTPPEPCSSGRESAPSKAGYFTHFRSATSQPVVSRVSNSQAVGSGAHLADRDVGDTADKKPALQATASSDRVQCEISGLKPGEIRADSRRLLQLQSRKPADRRRSASASLFGKTPPRMT